MFSNAFFILLFSWFQSDFSLIQTKANLLVLVRRAFRVDHGFLFQQNILECNFLLSQCNFFLVHLVLQQYHKRVVHSIVALVHLCVARILECRRLVVMRHSKIAIAQKNTSREHRIFYWKLLTLLTIFLFQKLLMPQFYLPLEFVKQI